MFWYGDTTNVEPEMYSYASYNRSRWKSNEKLKEKLRSYTRETVDLFTTADSYALKSHIIREILRCETGSLSGGVTAGSREVKGKGKGHPITGHQGPRGGVEV
jgi:hypothetical protein